MKKSIYFAFFPILASAASSSLQFIPLSNLTAQGVAPMANGSVAVYGAVAAGCSGSMNCNQTQSPLLSILDASGNQTAALPNSALGSGNSTVTGAAADADGNIWITGETNSDDFPLVNPLFSQKQDYKQDLSRSSARAWMFSFRPSSADRRFPHSGLPIPQISRSTVQETRTLRGTRKIPDSPLLDLSSEREAPPAAS